MFYIIQKKRGDILLKYYRCFSDKYDYNYSLDMVRYNFNLASYHSNDFIKLLNYYNLCIPNCIITYFPNKKSVGYTDLWTLTFENNNGDVGVCTIGKQLNFSKENLNSRIYRVQSK